MEKNTKNDYELVEDNIFDGKYPSEDTYLILFIQLIRSFVNKSSNSVNTNINSYC